MGAPDDTNDNRISRPSPGSLRLVLKHSDSLDKFLMALGTIGCVVDGLFLPVNMLVLSHLMNSYGGGPSAFTSEDINKVI